MDRNAAPESPCPGCMKREWEYIDYTYCMVAPEEEAKGRSLIQLSVYITDQDEVLCFIFNMSADRFEQI